MHARDGYLLSPSHPPNLQPFAGLLASAHAERDERPAVRGTLPAGLRGTLYINGPGLFERAGFRKHTLLDGDGMVVAFRFGSDGVQVHNRFVRTAKYVEEDRAHAYRYATWTTPRPGGWLANVGVRIHPRGQAGVSVRYWNGRLYAFDEGPAPWELDPETLQTLAFADWQSTGGERGPSAFAAHPKIDPRRHEWLHFGLSYGPRTMLHFTAFDAAGEVIRHRAVKLARPAYLHDWFVTERHVLFNLHPAFPSFGRLLAGRATFAGSLDWRPEEGSLLMLMPREGDAQPLLLPTDAVWMWHSLNAFETGGALIADFVGYDRPDHFIGPDPAFARMMTGGDDAATYPGTLRRLTIDLATHRVRQETLDGGHHEFPVVDPRNVAAPHRYGYFAAGTPGAMLWHGVARVDMHGGSRRQFDFGASQFCLEPIFVPDPDRTASGADEPGWVLVLVYDGERHCSRLAVLDAERLDDGPLAEVLLDHPVPLRFHGQWVPG